MQTINTSVLARRVRISSRFATLPYEAGWATEALFFTQVEGEHPELTITTEVSPDGVNWVQRGEVQVIRESEHIAANALAQFGNWVRAVISGATEQKQARVLVHVALKG
jgi:hypothetical protein